MNTIFFSDAGDVTLRCIFRGIFVFLSGGQCHACNAYAYIQKVSYFHAFFDKDQLFSFSAKRKNIIFSGKKKYHLSRYYKKIVFRREFFGKAIFSENLKKISYFQVFFWERSSFLLCLKNKIIFLGKINIIFPDNARKIIFQRNFFGKTIFS